MGKYQSISHYAQELRQRPNVRYQVFPTTGRFWPGAVVQFAAANGRTWQETSRTGEKMDS